MSFAMGATGQFAGGVSVGYDHSTPPPPPPPPKPNSGSATPSRGPPLPPPPPPDSGTSFAIRDSSQSHPYGQQTMPHPQVALPEHGWVPSFVHDLSTQDLHRLVESHDLQAALLNDPDTTHPSVPASQIPLQQLLDSNIASASSLQQLENRLVHQRIATQSRLLALRALEQQHRAKIADTEDALRNFSPMALYQRLNVSMQEQEALVKGIEESFLDGTGEATERELADFVRRVREAKRLAFLRAERKERWDEGRVGGWR